MSIHTPEIHKKVDGPMIVCTDGTVHYLTWFERLMFKLGFVSLEILDDAHRKDLPVLPIHSEL